MNDASSGYGYRNDAGNGDDSAGGIDETRMNYPLFFPMMISFLE